MNINWTAILFIIGVAIIIEAATEVLKKYIPWLEKRTWAVLSITVVLGILLALNYDADLFAAFGMKGHVAWVGCVVTGFLFSGGSNLVFDIIKRIQGAQKTVAEFEDYDDPALNPNDTGEVG